MVRSILLSSFETTVHQGIRLPFILSLVPVQEAVVLAVKKLASFILSLPINFGGPGGRRIRGFTKLVFSCEKWDLRRPHSLDRKLEADFHNNTELSKAILFIGRPHEGKSLKQTIALN